MAVTIPISTSDILNALTTDSTKFAGASIADLVDRLGKTPYLETTYTWDENTDGNVSFNDLPVPVVEEIGTWYWKGTFTTLGAGNDSIVWYVLYEDANNNYGLILYDGNSANGLLLYVTEATVGANVINKGSATSGTSEHYYEVKHDVFGNWETLEDGVSIGTAFNDFIPATVQTDFRFRSSAGNSVFELAELSHKRAVS